MILLSRFGRAPNGSVSGSRFLRLAEKRQPQKSSAFALTQASERRFTIPQKLRPHTVCDLEGMYTNCSQNSHPKLRPHPVCHAESISHKLLTQITHKHESPKFVMLKASYDNI